MDNILGVEVVHPLGSLPRDFDHVQQLELRLVDVQMLQIKKVVTECKLCQFLV